MDDQTDPDDLRSTSDLFNQALTNPDTDEFDSPRWQAIQALRRRPTLEVFARAKALCESACPQEQCIGCDVLAQLGAPEMPFATRSFPIVASVLPRADDLDAVDSALSALGWIGDLRAVDLILPFAEHPDHDIRFTIAHALTSLGNDPRSVAALIRLSDDPSAEVRDWSTFGLGSLVASDTQEIREALANRLDDPDRETRCEAILGFAIRKDIRAVEAVVRELSGDEWMELLFEAAELVADPKCLPGLLRVRERVGSVPGLEKAIQACGPKVNSS